MRVLIIDNESEWCMLLAKPLEREGFEVYIETLAENAIDRVEEVLPSIVVLDINLEHPEIDGFDIAFEINEKKELRDNSFRLILVSATYESETDMRLGFTIGADDYWIKPFSTGLLTQYIAKCRNRMDTAYSGHIDLGPDTYHDPVNGLFCLNGKEVSLTTRENDFLKYLASDNMSRKSQNQIEKNVWNRDVVEINAVQKCVSELRKKLGPMGKKIIATKYGQGYRLKSLTKRQLGSI